MLVNVYPVYRQGKNLLNKVMMPVIESSRDWTQNYISSFHILQIPLHSTLASLVYFQLLELLIFSLIFFSSYSVHSAQSILSYSLKQPYSLASTCMHLSFTHPFIHLRSSAIQHQFRCREGWEKDFIISKTLMASLLEGFGDLAEGGFSIPFPSCVSSQLCHRRGLLA